MLETVRWLLTAELVGLAAFPIAYAAFPNLSDRAWGFAKPIGLILIGLAVWGLSQAGVLPNDAWAWWLSIVAVAVVGCALVWRRRSELAAFVRRNRTPILVGEALFLAFFIAWTLFRVFDPNISGTEKPMDFMLLNASTAAQAAPPEDPWLSGQSVAYYYFGYWMFAGLGKAAFVKTSVAYNLSLSLVAGMAAGAIFTLAYSMVRRDGGNLRAALLAGAAGSALLLAVSNLTGWWELLANFRLGSHGFFDWLAIDGLERSAQTESWRPTNFWWWWKASRVINTFDESGVGLDFTIQEFPLFSLILGDLHPHVMSIPFVLAGMGVAYNILTSKEEWGFSWVRKNPATVVVLALLIGSAGFINAWDMAFLFAVLLGAVFIRTVRQRGQTAAWPFLSALPLIAIGVAGLLAFYPFYFGTLQTQIQWPPLLPAEFGTRPVHFFTVWAIPFLAAGVFLSTVAFRTLRPQFEWAWGSISGRGEAGGKPEIGPWIIGMAGIGLPYLVWGFTHLEYRDGAENIHLIERLWTVLPLGAAIVFLFVTVMNRARAGKNDAVQFALLLGLMALYLVYWAELLHVHDVFASRMNTVFKFYYQGLIILSAAGAYGLWRWRLMHLKLTRWALGASLAAAAVGIILLAGSLYYSVAASYSKAGEGGGDSLDGIAYIERRTPEEYAAIEFLRENASPGDRMVEAVGGSYSEFGRISGSTGVPTVLGWPGHERQWRGSNELVTPRIADVEELYLTADLETASALANRYGIDYVVVGQREKSKYPALNVEKFDTLGVRVFERNGLTIFCLKAECP